VVNRKEEMLAKYWQENIVINKKEVWMENKKTLMSGAIRKKILLYILFEQSLLGLELGMII